MKRSFFAIGLLIIAGVMTVNAQSIIKINSQEVNTLLRDNNLIVILDVRTPGEFVQGHIKGAINIDIHQSDAFDIISKLDKNAAYLVYCRTSNRSGVAVSYMNENGFKTVYQMTDGITGWNMNQYPVEK